MLKKRSGKEGPKKRDGLLPAAVKGAGIGIAVTAALLFLFCAILSGTEDPGPLTAPLALCALYLGGIAAGVCGAKRSKGGAAGGFLAGCVLACAILVLSLLPLPPSSFPATASMIFLGLLLPAGALGGILGTKKQQKRYGRH